MAPRIVAICGALRRDSSNRKLMMEALRLFGDCDTHIADIRWPLYDGDLEEAEGVPAPVRELAERIAAADGVIVASPEYNKMLPGVLKNALDWISRLKDNPWAGKPVAVMTASAGRTGGETAQFTLRHALTPFRPRLVPGPALMLADSRNQFDADGRLTNERAGATLSALMQALHDEIRRAAA